MTFFSKRLSWDIISFLFLLSLFRFIFFFSLSFLHFSMIFFPPVSIKPILWVNRGFRRIHEWYFLPYPSGFFWSFHILRCQKVRMKVPTRHHRHVVLFLEVHCNLLDWRKKFHQENFFCFRHDQILAKIHPDSVLVPFLPVRIHFQSLILGWTIFENNPKSFVLTMPFFLTFLAWKRGRRQKMKGEWREEKIRGNRRKKKIQAEKKEKRIVIISTEYIYIYTNRFKHHFIGSIQKQTQSPIQLWQEQRRRKQEQRDLSPYPRVWTTISAPSPTTALSARSSDPSRPLASSVWCIGSHSYLLVSPGQLILCWQLILWWQLILLFHLHPWSLTRLFLQLGVDWLIQGSKLSQWKYSWFSLFPIIFNFLRSWTWTTECVSSFNPTFSFLQPNFPFPSIQLSLSFNPFSDSWDNSFFRWVMNYDSSLWERLHPQNMLNKFQGERHCSNTKRENLHRHRKKVS